MPGKSRKERKSVKVQKASKNNTRKNKVQKKNMKKQTKNMKKQKGKSMKKLLKKQMKKQLKKTLKGGTNGNGNGSRKKKRQMNPNRMNNAGYHSDVTTENDGLKIRLTILRQYHPIAKTLMKRVESVIRSGYISTEIPRAITIFCEAMNKDDFVNGVAGCLAFIQRDVNVQEIADYIVHNIAPDSVYLPIPEIFYGVELIRDLQEQRLLDDQRVLNRNRTLQMIEQVIIEQGEILVLPTEPNLESLESATNTNEENGMRTELSSEYKELMKQIEDIIQEQHKADGPDAITDLQLISKNVLLSVERLRLQCKQVIRNLPRTIVITTGEAYLNICQQIANSVTLNQVFNFLIGLDKTRFNVATEEEVRIQALLRSGARFVGYVKRTYVRGIIIPFNSMINEFMTGIRSGNAIIEQDERVAIAEKIDNRNILNYVRWVLTNANSAIFLPTCVELHILSLYERINFRGAPTNQTQGAENKESFNLVRSASTPLARAPTRAPSRAPRAINPNIAPVIVDFLTTEYDLRSCINDYIIAATNREPVLLMSSNISYYNKLLEILGIGRLGHVQPLTFKPEMMGRIDENTFAFIMTRTKLGNRLKQLQINFATVLDALRLLRSPNATMPSNIDKILGFLNEDIFNIEETLDNIGLRTGRLRDVFERNILNNLIDMLRATNRAMDEDDVVETVADESNSSRLPVTVATSAQTAVPERQTNSRFIATLYWINRGIEHLITRYNTRGATNASAVVVNDLQTGQPRELNVNPIIARYAVGNMIENIETIRDTRQGNTRFIIPDTSPRGPGASVLQPAPVRTSAPVRTQPNTSLPPTPVRTSVHDNSHSTAAANNTQVQTPSVRARASLSSSLQPPPPPLNNNNDFGWGWGDENN